MKRDDSKCTLGCQGCFLVAQNIKEIRRMAANPLILWRALESNTPRGFFIMCPHSRSAILGIDRIIFRNECYEKQEALCYLKFRNIRIPGMTIPYQYSTPFTNP